MVLDKYFLIDDNEAGASPGLQGQKGWILTSNWGVPKHTLGCFMLPTPVPLVFAQPEPPLFLSRYCLPLPSPSPYGLMAPVPGGWKRKLSAQPGQLWGLSSLVAITLVSLLQALGNRLRSTGSLEEQWDGRSLV